jgi:excisionase family DNA binding protein
MSQELYSVDQVAAILDLHVRTVRNYVRDGRLKAVRIGKQYRIARADLEALTGRPVVAPDPVPRHRHVEVSSIVQMDAIGPDAASRVTNTLMAAVKSGKEDDQPLRIDTIYDQERGRLKVILTGGIAATVALLRLITVVEDSRT